MCDPETNEQICTTVQTPPHELLAKAFKEDLGVDIHPQALRMFIRTRWSRVSALSHLIHEGK